MSTPSFSSLYNTVVPSCGSGTGLNPPHPPKLPLQEEPSCEEQQQEDPPLGLVTLLTEQGISAQRGAASALALFPRGSGTLSWLSPPLGSLWRCRWGGLGEWALGSPRLRQREEEEDKPSIFSLNLVEKLQQLGLDKVVRRGEASYAASHLQGLHRRKRCLS